MRRLAVLLFFLFAFTACAKKPTMKLNHAELTGGSVSIGFPPQLQASVLMTCVVDVYNPNSYDVAVRAMRGTVKLAGKYDMPIDFRGPPEGVWLPADQTTSLRVPVAIPVNLAIQLMQESMSASTIDFEIIGKADVTATRTFQIEKDNYEVDEKGTITRAQMDAAIRSVIPFGGALPVPH